jgi:hypothetical protein
LPHHTKAAADGDGARLRVDVLGDEPDECGLASAVGPGQGRGGALADPERRISDQLPSVRQGVAEVRHIDVTHLIPPQPGQPPAQGST